MSEKYKHINYGINGEQYSILYKKYLDKDPRNLFGIRNLENTEILDLCCGTGTMGFYALKNNAHNVTFVDSDPSMFIHNDNILNYSFKPYLIETYLQTWCNISVFDIIVCRQAVNYWLKDISDELINKLSKMLKSTGVFIFNTFEHSLSEKPEYKSYTYEEKAYHEVSWREKNSDVIKHIQICEGLPHHYTEFDYLPKTLIDSKLGKYFNIKYESKGWNSLLVECSRLDR